MDQFLHLQGALSLTAVIFIWSWGVLTNLATRLPDPFAILVSPIVLFFPFLFYYLFWLIHSQIESLVYFLGVLLFDILFALLLREVWGQRHNFRGKNGVQ